MRVIHTAAVLGLAAALMSAPAAFATSDQTGSGTPKNHHDTAKGAAAGALVGHEMGSGHAVAGAGVGALAGHHEEKKAEKNGS